MKLYSKLTIAPKLAIMLVLPMVGLAYFAGQDFKTQWETVEEMETVDDSIRLSLGVSDLAYRLAAERGLSNALLKSRGNTFAGELAVARRSTNAALDSWRVTRESIDETRLEASVQAALQVATNKLGHVSDCRDEVRQASGDGESVFARYSEIIASLMDVVDRMTVDVAIDDINALMMSLDSLLQTMESLGKGRALLTSVAVSGSLPATVAEELRALDSNQRAFATVFAEYAPEGPRATLRAIGSQRVARRADELMRAALSARPGDTLTLDPLECWAAKTELLEQHKALLQQIGKDLLLAASVHREDSQAALRWGLAGTLLVFLAANLVGFFTARGIRARLREAMAMTGEISHGAHELGSMTNELRATIVQQDATTNEIVATTNQISATGAELLESIRQVSGTAGETADSASKGMGELMELETTMEGISAASGQVVDRLSELSEKAGNINSVASLIAKVADQTNLLSLNAAIEAEKAGEYGSGFAVVATEIRRLADQTAVAVLEIEQTVKEIQSAVSAGVMSMDQFAMQARTGVDNAGNVNERLKGIIGQVEDLPQHFLSVQEGMESQSTGAMQISEAMAQLSETSRHTRESAELSAATTLALEDAVKELRMGVSRFTVRGLED